MRLFGKLRDFLPSSGFIFKRPLVIFQSDDWGRVGLRDTEGLEQLRQAGLNLGERPYDLYSLETADDLETIRATLKRHRDSAGRSPVIEMNFITGNLDFGRMENENWQEIHLLQLSEGLPAGWKRPCLFESYRQGILEGLFHPALHGTTHFCRSEVHRNLQAGGDQAEFLKTLWQAGTPYIHWRMPWIGYEYWAPENDPKARFLPAQFQKQLIGEAVGAFAKMFGQLPGSACAPGYRANDDTVRSWAEYGIKVAQNGPGAIHPPHFDRRGMLQLFRTVEFEPAVDSSFSVQGCIRAAEACFSRGIPAVVSVHSINFHSSVRDFRNNTLKNLDEFLTALESSHNDLLYLHDEDLYQLIERGSYQSHNGIVQVEVRKKTFTRASLAQNQA